MEDYYLYMDLIFDTSEDATMKGHPNAPCLAEYGISRDQFFDYVQALKKNKEKRRNDNFDEKLNVVWFFLFSLGIPLFAWITKSSIITITYIVIMTACVFFIHKYHYARYDKDFKTLYNQDIEFYFANLKRYKNKHSVTSERKQMAVEQFPSYRKLDDGWIIKEVRPLLPNEISAIRDATVVLFPQDSEKFVRLSLKGGSTMHIPLSKTSPKNEGEKIDVSKANWLTVEDLNGSSHMWIEC